MDFLFRSFSRRLRWRFELLELIFLTTLLGITVSHSSGCASAQSTAPPPSISYVDPAFKARRSEISKIAVLPPRIIIFQQTAGGKKERVDDWSNLAQGNIAKALRAELTKRLAIQVTFINEADLSSEQASTLRKLESRLAQANKDLALNVYCKKCPYSNNPTIEGEEDDDYTAGVGATELAPGEDALLFVYGADLRATSSRKVLQGSLFALGAVVGVVPILGFGQPAVSVGLVDPKTGTILWHHRVPNILESSELYDLRETTGASDSVKQLLINFPY